MGLPTGRAIFALLPHPVTTPRYETKRYLSTPYTDFVDSKRASDGHSNTPTVVGMANVFINKLGYVWNNKVRHIRAATWLFTIVSADSTVSTVCRTPRFLVVFLGIYVEFLASKGDLQWSALFPRIRSSTCFSRFSHFLSPFLIAFEGLRCARVL